MQGLRGCLPPRTTTAMPALGWRGYTAPSAQNKSVHNRWAARMPGVGAGRWFSCVRGTRRASPSNLHHVAARSVFRQAPLPCTTLSAREGDVCVRVCVLSERGPSACQRCQRPQSCCLNVSPVRSCLRRRAHVLRGARASGWTGSALPQARFGAHFICDPFTCHGGCKMYMAAPGFLEHRCMAPGDSQMTAGVCQACCVLALPPFACTTWPNDEPILRLKC